MKELLENIFIKSGFDLSEERDNTTLYEKKGKEYFLLADYSKDELNNFFSCKKTTSLISFFDILKRKILDREKNTSLIVCIEVDDLRSDIDELKNQIFKIEEDDYYFKKYVIVYSANSLLNIQLSGNIVKTLHEKIKDGNKFDEFQKDSFFSDEYFLVVQLFVKLPFIVFESIGNKFRNLADIIKDEVQKQGLGEIENRIIHDNIEVNEIEEAFLGDEYAETMVDKYIESFKNHKDED